LINLFRKILLRFAGQNSLFLIRALKVEIIRWNSNRVEEKKKENGEIIRDEPVHFSTPFQFNQF
jgi:hypothetical protein